MIIKNKSGVTIFEVAGRVLGDADFNDADLSGANLSCANLDDAALDDADLSGANLSCANLSGANLDDADLSGANLRCANLRGANLSGANLRGANLRSANLRGADLCDADLRGAKMNPMDREAIVSQRTILADGDIIGWKKLVDGTICKLLIPADAERVGGVVGRKCRASYAKVLEGSGTSAHNGAFVYFTGETVHPDKFDADPFVECSHGIHFFITKHEAEKY